MKLTEIEYIIKSTFHDLENKVEGLKKKAPDAEKIIDSIVRRRAARLTVHTNSSVNRILSRE